MRRLAMILALAVALAAAQGAHARDVGKRPPGQFDYYVLSLTWVPGFCATHHDPNECGKGLGFGLHGLWPQFENHDYPSGCSAAPLTAADRQKYQGIYASPTMIDHEWSKHGTCSGLSADDYFDLSEADAKKVAIPPVYQHAKTVRAKDVKALKAALLGANPSLPVAGLVTVVTGGRLSEVQVCMTKAGDFRSCAPQ